MIDKITGLVDYFRKIPGAFFIAIVLVLGLCLFVSEGIARTLAIDEFRDKYRVFLGPTFLLAVSFSGARLFTFFIQSRSRNHNRKARQKALHELTPEERGYLVPYVLDQQNTIYVGLDDGVMGGLVVKKITYRASNMGDVLKGFAFNLQPWARAYLEDNCELLDGYIGEPMTPRQKLHSQRRRTLGI